MKKKAFEHPIPEGWYAACNDGIVTQVTLFNCQEEYPLAGVLNGSRVNYTADGRYSTKCSTHDLDLYLLPSPPNVPATLLEIADRYTKGDFWGNESGKCDAPDYKATFINAVGQLVMDTLPHNLPDEFREQLKNIWSI